MKGAQGLIVAVLLGGLGIALNWIYLQNKARHAESVNFVGIDNGQLIKPGEMIEESHLVSVPVPEMQAKTLRDFVVLYQDVNTVVGRRAIRTMSGGEFIYRHDLRTPPPELELKAGERLIWVPVDSQGFVPSLLNPGDQIVFLIPTADRAPAAGAKEKIPLTAVEEVGPFTIKTIGNRLGSAEVFKGENMAQVQERSIGIVVREDGGKLEAKAQTLIDLISRSNRRNINIAVVGKAKP